MKAISLAYRYQEYRALWRGVCMFALCAASVLLIANAIFVGLTIGAAAGQARAQARADALSLRITELQTQFSTKKIITAVEAASLGFKAPVGLSYTAKRSLGRAPTGNEL